MTTTDLGEYFKDFNPVSCEWCDGKSANIVWGLDASAAKAMCYLSRPIGKTNYFNQVFQSKIILGVKFIYSEKATKYCEISTIDLFYVVPVKFTVELLQNFVAFSEYVCLFVTEEILYSITAVSGQGS